MSALDLPLVRLRLQRRRREILEASRRRATAIDELRRAERDPEMEEASQSEQQQYDLLLLREVAQRELAQIDAAIARLDAGEFGTCRGCGDAIDPSRLDALPFVVECPDCARLREGVEELERARKRAAGGLARV